MDPQTAADITEIIQVTNRYCHAIDGGDWDTLRERVFLPDAVMEFRPGDPDHQRNDIDGIVDYIATALGPLDTSQHLVGSHVVEVDGDEATCRCYLHGQHVRRAAEGGPHMIVALTYDDRVVRTEAGWRIAHRRLVPSWREGNPEVMRPG
ncbi:MAG: nuclear transport factor 2 family protein [Actinomycetota bacterium]